MKMNAQSLLKTLLLAVAFLAARTQAEEIAVITDNRVNVRAQAYLYSEVVTQLQKGDKVTILERISIPVEKQKPAEPTNWARIRMPTNTPVWVFAPYLEGGKAKVNKLNLRAGPGENFSVVGRVERDRELKIIRTLEDWTEVETPPEAYAFIDNNLVQVQEGEAPAEPAQTEVKPQETTPPPPAETITDAAPVEQAAATATESAAATPPPPIAPVTEPAASTPVDANPVSEPVVTKVEPPPFEPPTQEKVRIETVEPASKAPSTSSIQPAPEPEALTAPNPVTPDNQKLPELASLEDNTQEALPKRLVRREGIVRSTRSIQAPTYFELINPETKKTMNYLHGEDVGINVKNFRDKKVVVTGPEGIDPRWPNVPVISVESIETAP